MKLHIDDSKTIKEIQDEFVNVFKYIKVEFFKKSHEEGEGSAKKDLLEHSKTLGEIRTIHNEGDLIITKDMKVGEVENAFENMFGIHAQIFRRQNNVWLITSNSDSWTLAEQIEKAEEMKH